MKKVFRWLAALGIAAALAGGLVMLYQAKPEPLAAGAQADYAREADPLTRFRTEREQLRAKQRAELNDIIHDDATDAETLSMAKRRLMALMDSENAETTLEGILSARGFEDALASVNADSVYIMVRSEGLNRQQSAVILDLALRQTGVTAGNVKILSIN